MIFLTESEKLKLRNELENLPEFMEIVFPHIFGNYSFSEEGLLVEDSVTRNQEALTEKAQTKETISEMEMC